MEIIKFYFENGKVIYAVKSVNSYFSVYQLCFKFHDFTSTAEEMIHFVQLMINTKCMKYCIIYMAVFQRFFVKK